MPLSDARRRWSPVQLSGTSCNVSLHNANSRPHHSDAGAYYTLWSQDKMTLGDTVSGFRVPAARIQELFGKDAFEWTLSWESKTCIETIGIHARKLREAGQLVREFSWRVCLLLLLSSHSQHCPLQHLLVTFCTSFPSPSSSALGRRKAP